jgi:hypothetical protein
MENNGERFREWLAITTKVFFAHYLKPTGKKLACFQVRQLPQL